MNDLYKNAISFLQKKYPAAVVAQEEMFLINGNERHNFLAAIVIDQSTGTKFRAIVPQHPIKEDFIHILSNVISNLFLEFDRKFEIQFDNVLQKTQSKISAREMPFSKIIFFYLREIEYSLTQYMIDFFMTKNISISVHSEDKMYHSLYIIYGDPDKDIASKFNEHFKKRGVKTWFFPEDSQAGVKLHRMMYEGVKNNDRVLLICSENSLNRLGVLNEIEEVFTKEAKNGGVEILIPISIDDYIFGNKWAPSNKDLKDRLLSRVTKKIDCKNINSEVTIKELDRLVQLLLK